MGATEESMHNREKMRHDPKKSDKEARKKSLGFVQNQPLYAMDK